MSYCKYLICIICFLPAKIFAQNANLSNTDITGLWKGTLYNDTTHQFYRYEIAISEEKGKLTGFSHTWFILDDKQYYGVKKVKIKEEDGKIIIEDNGLIANNYPVAPAKGVHQLNILELNAADSIMTLTGPFTTNSTKIYRSLTGTINLQRKNDYWQSALVPHLEELGLVKELSFVKDDVALTQKNETMITVMKPVVKPKPVEKIQSISIAKNDLPIQKEETKVVIENETVLNEKPIADKNIVSEKKYKEDQSTAVVKKKITTSSKNIKPSEKKPVIKNEAAEKTSIVSNEKSKPIIAEKTITTQKPVVIEKSTTGIATQMPIVKNSEKVSVDKKIPQVENNSIVTIEKPVIPATEKTTISQTTTTPEKTPDVTLSAKPLQPVASVKPDEIIYSNAAKEVDTRKTLLTQTVFFKADSLQLTLYDNGEVDGDTVSVLMNGNVIMPRVGLSTNAVRKTIYINPDEDSIQLVMYAENLGSIPPNTGLLVVKDGKDIYEIRFSGDLQKNAAIIFRRKKIN